MKKYFFSLLLMLSVILFQGCSIIGDIFQAGLWTGIIIVAIVVLIVIIIIVKIKKK